MQIGVDCVFAADGTVRARRVLVSGAWQPVEPGRQWSAADGRHLLVMLPGQQVREIVLRADTLAWEMRPPTGRPAVV